MKKHLTLLPVVLMVLLFVSSASIANEYYKNSIRPLIEAGKCDQLKSRKAGWLEGERKVLEDRYRRLKGDTSKTVEKMLRLSEKNQWPLILRSCKHAIEKKKRMSECVKHHSGNAGSDINIYVSNQCKHARHISVCVRIDSDKKQKVIKTAKVPAAGKHVFTVPASSRVDYKYFIKWCKAGKCPVKC